MYINKVQLYGNLTRDPELKSTPTGNNVCSFGIATNRTYVDKNGGKQEDVQFHNIVAWGKQADTIARYTKKGAAIFVEGRLTTRSWEDKNGGGKRFATEVVLENLQFGPKPATAGEIRPPLTSAPHVSATVEMDTIEYPSDDVNVDDIPF